MTNLKISYVAANAQAAAVSALVSGGTLIIYSGTQPATPETTIGNSIALATFALASPAFAAPVSGQITLNPITPASIVATANATWYRIYQSDGVTPVFDGNIGTIVGGAWAESTTYAINSTVSANGNAYQCMTAGTSASSGTGPGGIGANIVDGTAAWTYLSIANGDINFSSTAFTTGSTVALSSYTFLAPGV